MEERENLKNYSSEFKKYINTLNLQESSRTQIDLNIPDLSTLVEADLKQPVETKSFLTHGGESVINSNQSEYDYASQLSEHTQDEGKLSQPDKQTNHSTKGNSTTLIQRKTSSTQIEQEPTATNQEGTQEGTKANTKTNPIKQDFPIASDGLFSFKFKI